LGRSTVGSALPHKLGHIPKYLKEKKDTLKSEGKK
jgi:hypothetical protein